MKVNFGNKEISFLWVYILILFIFIAVLFYMLYVLKFIYMKILFGIFIVFLLVILAYYWIDSRGYYNNLGRIRRSFYTLYLLTMSIGFITGDVDYNNWKLLLQLTALVVFVDLAVFQNPNILKIFNAEFRHDDEIRGALTDTKDTILQNANKIEKFTEIVQETEEYFLSKNIPVSIKEYKNDLEDYFETYSGTFGFDISLFIFDTPKNDKIKENIKLQLKEVTKRHAIKLPSQQVKRENIVEELSNGETVIWIEEELISIPYFGLTYSMIATLEARNVPVDGIDASLISNMMVMFEWYMMGEIELEE